MEDIDERALELCRNKSTSNTEMNTLKKKQS